jgi:uncharacterized protein (DUF2336 family)
MTAQQSLMDELEGAVQSGSREKRIDALRRITDLFLAAPAQLNAEQIGVFDDVLTHLVERVETKARAELAKRLAPVVEAPNEVIQRLARDDEIAVAGPVLTQSTRLTTSDLVDIARQNGQGHLLAIAGRDLLEERVTDVLVDRGNRDVVQTLAANTGAAFSQSGYAALVKRADGDETFVEKLGRRLDVPLALFRELLLRATEAVRARLLASASEDQRDVIMRVLADISHEISDETPNARNVEDAKRLLQMMKETGRPNEAEIMTFARHMKYEEMIAGVAMLCSVPFDLIDRLTHSDRSDALLVPCKAAGLRWATVRAILQLRSTRHRPRNTRSRPPPLNLKSCRPRQPRACCDSGRCARPHRLRPAADKFLNLIV